jgi:uncharacterized MAPEG superfamily protein
MTALPQEIIVLALSTVLMMVQIGLQGILATRELGRSWNAGPRDDGLRPTDVHAGRAERALKNLLETYPAFVALALGLVVTERAGGLGAFGAWLWLTGRIVYVPLYLAGTPYIRTLAWIAAAVGLTLMFIRLVF